MVALKYLTTVFKFYLNTPNPQNVYRFLFYHIFFFLILHILSWLSFWKTCLICNKANVAIISEVMVVFTQSFWELSLSPPPSQRLRIQQKIESFWRYIFIFYLLFLKVWFLYLKLFLIINSSFDFYHFSASLVWRNLNLLHALKKITVRLCLF